MKRRIVRCNCTFLAVSTTGRVEVVRQRCDARTSFVSETSLQGSGGLLRRGVQQREVNDDGDRQERGAAVIRIVQAVGRRRRVTAIKK